jgi:hypothetical protein
VPTRKRQQLGLKFLEPGGFLGQQDRAAHEQIDLRNKTLLLFPSGSVFDGVDMLFAQGLDQPVADAASGEGGRMGAFMKPTLILVLLGKPAPAPGRL